LLLTLRQEHRQRVFEYRVCRGISGTMRKRLENTA